jgi:hypothetical protein
VALSDSSAIQWSAAPAPLTRLVCPSCGYGVSCRLAPERCPECGGGTWERQTWRLLHDGILGWATDGSLSVDDE